MSSASFKNVITKICLQIVYIQCMCIDTIWHQIICNGLYAIKNQPTNQPARCFKETTP